ncbi:MAG: ferritin-like domain-containing protein [Saprospiraceae bacterium]|nr:ferritin-like domain-containing protein [Saprospiraceae bacterium]
MKLQISNKNKKSTNGIPLKQGIAASQLTTLLEDGLKDMYWAEKALTKAIPKMIKNASSEELIDVLENHLDETRNQIGRMEQVFEIIGKKAVGKKCEAMEGLIKEGEGIMEDCEDGPMMDAGIIAASQKIEHYEIASYGTLRQFASTLGFSKAAKLLEATLKEEKSADESLSEVATSTINIQAAAEVANKK